MNLPANNLAYVIDIGGWIWLTCGLLVVFAILFALSSRLGIPQNMVIIVGLVLLLIIALVFFFGHGPPVRGVISTGDRLSPAMTIAAAGRYHAARERASFGGY